MAQFPSNDWLMALAEKLNTDEHYAQVARNWEGDLLVVALPGGALEQALKAVVNLDLPYENANRAGFCPLRL